MKKLLPYQIVAFITHRKTIKRHGENIDKPSVKIYVSKIENRITFKIKIGYSLELLTPKQWNYFEALKIK